MEGSRCKSCGHFFPVGKTGVKIWPSICPDCGGTCEVVRGVAPEARSFFSRLFGKRDKPVLPSIQQSKEPTIKSTLTYSLLLTKQYCQRCRGWFVQPTDPNALQLFHSFLCPNCRGPLSARIARYVESPSRTEKEKNSKRVGQTGFLKHIAMPGFPQILPKGLLSDLATLQSAFVLVEDGNVLLKTNDSELENIRKYDCLFELELYYIRHNIMPIIRTVLIVLDNIKNPSVYSNVCDINKQRHMSNLSDLKIVHDIGLHTYDNQNRFKFTKKVRLAELPPENTGGPASGVIMKIEIDRTSWHGYVESLIKVAESMCELLPSEIRNFQVASDEFKSYPLTCLCEICGRLAYSTKSQFPGMGPIDVAKCKSSDAMYCRKCNLILCMDCLAKRMKTNEVGQVISPLTCSICGSSFIAY
jgi:hypothetical protein